jgi:hypothetical protein
MQPLAATHPAPPFPDVKAHQTEPEKKEEGRTDENLAGGEGIQRIRGRVLGHDAMHLLGITHVVAVDSKGS